MPPLYQQLYRALREAILRGELKAGDRLPATRALAEERGLSRNVVLRAYEQLLAEGYVQGRVGSGTYVAGELPEELPPPREARSEPAEGGAPRLSAFGRRVMALEGQGPRFGSEPAIYDFRYGEAPPEEATLRHWRRLLGRSSRATDLGYGPPAGLAELRRALAAHLGRARGVHCEPDQVVLTGGSQQALDLSARLLVDPGDRVLIEEPSYQGARLVFQAAGAELVPVPVDAEGLDPAAIPARGATARLAYLTPSHQFPSGAVLSLSRRLALLEWARESEAYLLEDDYDSEYRYGGRPVEAVQGLDRHGRTLYIGTLSKVLFPALRIGFLVLPRALVPAFLTAKWLADRHVPLLEQRALAAFLEEGHFERHLRRMRTLHAHRRRVLLEALEEHFGGRIEVEGTNAGIHIVVWLRDCAAAELGPVVEEAARWQVSVQPITPYYLEPPERAGLLLGYSMLDEAGIREGIRRLAAAFRAHRDEAKGGP